MKTLIGSSLLLSAALLTGCSQHLSFTGSDANSSKSTTQCTPGEKSEAIPTKFLFIVDMSGSNFDGPYEHPGVATDKTKSFRYGVINQFFQEHSASSNVSWGFETFNGSAAKSLIAPGFSNASSMSAALQLFMQTADTGQTPYQAALQMAHDMIQRDMKTAVAGTQYRIAFLTDGYPTDYCSGSSTATDCTIDDSAINAAVESLINLSPSAIEFSTVYYGLPDASASARLQNMAYYGNGQFVDTNKSSNIKLDDIIQVPVTCPAN